MECKMNYEFKSEKELLESIDKDLEIIKTNSNKSNHINNDYSFEKEESKEEDDIRQFLLDSQIMNKNSSESSDSEDENEDKIEEQNIFKNILNDLNKNIEINIKETQIENKNYEECQEILSILKKPLSHKNLKTSYLYSPFKQLIRPKRVSLKGRVLSDIPDDTENSISKGTTKITNTTNCS